MLLLVAVALAVEERFALAGLAAGLCAFTKNEGAIELAALFLAVLLVAGRRAAVRFALGAAAPVALLAYFKLRWAPPNDLATQTRLGDVLRHAPRRIGIVARGFALEAVDFSRAPSSSSGNRGGQRSSRPSSSSVLRTQFSPHAPVAESQ